MNNDEFYFSMWTGPKCSIFARTRGILMPWSNQLYHERSSKPCWRYRFICSSCMKTISWNSNKRKYQLLLTNERCRVSNRFNWCHFVVEYCLVLESRDVLLFIGLNQLCERIWRRQLKSLINWSGWKLMRDWTIKKMHEYKLMNADLSWKPHLFQIFQC